MKVGDIVYTIYSTHVLRFGRITGTTTREGWNGENSTDWKYYVVDWFPNKQFQKCFEEAKVGFYEYYQAKPIRCDHVYPVDEDMKNLLRMALGEEN